jgi:hypothetical protein
MLQNDWHKKAQATDAKEVGAWGYPAEETFCCPCVTYKRKTSQAGNGLRFWNYCVKAWLSKAGNKNAKPMKLGLRNPV